MIHKALRFIEKQVMRGLGKGHGTKTVAAEVRAVERLLGDSDLRVCVDIGANIGDYSAELLDRFAGASVIAFEPSATNIAHLTARFAGQDRLRIVPAAVGDHDGTAVLHSDVPGSGLASLSRRDLDYLGLAFDVEESVRVMRFEDFWRTDMAGCAIDLLKLDIEGHEMDALSGAGAAIEAARAVQFEFGGCNIDTRTYFKDFWNFFSERGFELFRITPFGVLAVTRYSERDEIFTTTNYIAIRGKRP